MATIFAPYYKYLSLFILIVGVLYQYEIPKNSSLPNAGDTFILTKAATLSIGRAQAYKIIADIDKYPLVRCFAYSSCSYSIELVRLTVVSQRGARGTCPARQILGS